MSAARAPDNDFGLTSGGLPEAVINLAISGELAAEKKLGQPPAVIGCKARRSCCDDDVPCSVECVSVSRRCFMDVAERVGFCCIGLENAQHDFPATSTEVRTAENLYVRALNEATCGGSPAVTGSDLSLTDDSRIHVGFYCDKVNVTAVFYVGADKVGRPRVFGTSDAAKLGQEVADTGILGDCPVEVSISAIKNFGIRLKAYGQTGL